MPCIGIRSHQNPDTGQVVVSIPAMTNDPFWDTHRPRPWRIHVRKHWPAHALRGCYSRANLSAVSAIISITGNIKKSLMAPDKRKVLEAIKNAKERSKS